MNGSFTISQSGGAGAGTPGVSRNDLWTSILVQLSDAGNATGVRYLWELLYKPEGSIAGFVPSSGPTVDPRTGDQVAVDSSTSAHPTITPDVSNATYRVRLTLLDASGKVLAQTTRIFACTKDSAGNVTGEGLRAPAFGERDEDANWGGNAYGYAPDFEAIVAATSQGGVGSDVVWAPGQEASGRRVTTAASAYGLINASFGVVRLVVDSGSASATIPKIGDDPFDADYRLVIAGANKGDSVLGSARAALHFANTANSITNPKAIEDLIVVNDGAAVPFLLSMNGTDGGSALEMRNVKALGTASNHVFEVQGDAAEIHVYGTCELGDGTNVTIQGSVPGVVIHVYGASTIADNAIEANGATATVDVYVHSPFATVSSTQVETGGGTVTVHPHP